MKRIILLLLIVAAASVRLSAQVSTAQISGHVYDENKDPLPGVTIVLFNPSTNRTTGTMTNERGIYNLVGVQPGRYQLSATFIGYHKTTSNIQLTVGQNAVIDFNMVPSSVQLAQVDVVSNAPKFELSKSDISTTVRAEQIMQLPAESRNVLNLAGLSPGVKSYSPVGGQTLPSAGAVSSYNFLNLYVNGVEWKSLYNGNIVGLGQTGSPLAQDAIQEFKVVLNAYDAEYTRGGSFIISAITKRGSNDLRLTSFGTFQNNSFLARGPFQKTVPDYNRQQAGISISGPIIRDKTFYAVTYELQNINNFLDVIPGQPKFNPTLWSGYAGTFKSPRVNHIGSVALTHYLDQDNVLDLNWNTRYTDAKFYFGGNVAYQAGLHGTYKVNDLSLRHTHMFTPKVMNELTLQYLAWRHDEPTMSSGPAYIYPSIQLGRGDFPIQLSEDHYGLIDRFTFMTGPHVFKAGIEAKNIHAAPWFPYYAQGQFNFTTDTSKLPYQALIGIGAANPNSTDDARGKTSGWALGVFIQDKWQISDRLTINYGVRWDGEVNMLNNDYTVPWVNDTAIVNHVPSNYLNRGNRKNSMNNISPRFSFNYDLFGNNLTFFRGGGGLFYDRTVGYLGYFEWLYSNWRIYTIQNPGTTDVNALKQRILSGTGTAKPDLYLVDVNMDVPRIFNWSVGFSHQLSENFAVSADYVWKHYDRIYKSYNANYYIPSLKTRAISNNFGNMDLYSSMGKAEYYGILSTLTYRRGEIFAQLAYTLSWTYSQNDANSYVLKSLYYMQRSNLDERHRFVLNFSYDFPLGIQFGGIFTLASPTPFTRYIGQDINNDNSFTDDWVNGQRWDIANPKKIRNWYKMLDVRLSKYINFTETFRLGIMFEAYNVGNWFNASGYFGRMEDASGNPLLNYATPSGTYMPRSMQLGFRLYY